MRAQSTVVLSRLRADVLFGLCRPTVVVVGGRGENVRRTAAVDVAARRPPSGVERRAELVGRGRRRRRPGAGRQKASAATETGDGERSRSAARREYDAEPKTASQPPPPPLLHTVPACGENRIFSG